MAKWFITLLITVFVAEAFGVQSLSQKQVASFLGLGCQFQLSKEQEMPDYDDENLPDYDGGQVNLPLPSEPGLGSDYDGPMVLKGEELRIPLYIDLPLPPLPEQKISKRGKERGVRQADISGEEAYNDLNEENSFSW